MSDLALTITRVTSLPFPLDNNTLYIVRDPATSEIYLHCTGRDATIMAKTIRSQDVANMIATASLGFTSVVITRNIGDMQALSYTKNTFIYVDDATTDPTVEFGAASYIYNAATGQFAKVAQAIIPPTDWDDIVGRPDAVPDDIDDAVTRRHGHINKATLDALSEIEGRLCLNGAPVSSMNFTSNW